MYMPRKLLYDYIQESNHILPFWGTTCYVLDHKTNYTIGFNECFDILNQIKENVINENYSFSTDNCDFIKQIELDCISTKGLEDILKDDVMTYKSELISYENSTVKLKLTTYNWKEDKDSYISYPYTIIQNSLYLVYYRYLKKANPDHIFVKFVELLSKLHWHDPGCEKYISLKDYIDSLQETENKEINESLFEEPNKMYDEIYSKIKAKFCGITVY